MAGEGSIYRRADGLWVAAVSEGPRHARTRTYRYGRTRTEARAALEEVMAERRLGEPSRLSLGVYLRRWLADGTEVRARTKIGYEQIVTNHLSVLGDVPLAQLTAPDIQRLLNTLARTRKPQTVRNVHAVLRRALEQAVRWDLVPRNVAKLVVVPRSARPKMTALDAGQVNLLLASLAGDPLHPLVAVAVTTGMRQGELLGLTWANVDLPASRAKVEQQLTRDGLGPLKTTASRRSVPLSGYVVTALREHRVRQLEARLAAGTDTEDGLVFVTSEGLPLTGWVVLRDLHAALDRAGLPRIRFHDLRHTAASLMLGEGIPLRTVMEILGHTTISTTADIYGHVAPEVSRRAAASMDRVLSGSVAATVAAVGSPENPK